MAHSPETRLAVRNSYVYERLDLKAAAKKHGVPYETARSWKKADESKGDRWDFARNATRRHGGPAGDLSVQILEDFAIQYQTIMEDIRKAKKIEPKDRVDMLTKLGDSYVKIMKVAGGEDNKIAKLSVALETIGLLAEFIRTEYPELLEAFANAMERFSPEVTKHYG